MFNGKGDEGFFVRYSEEWNHLINVAQFLDIDAPTKSMNYDSIIRPALEEIVYSDDDEDVGAEADMKNTDAFMPVSPFPTTRVRKDHPIEQIIRDLNSAPQTRRMTNQMQEHGLVSRIQQINHIKTLQNVLFACFLSQVEPKKVIQTLKDPSWIEAMQDELLQFKLQKVWILVDLPKGKRAIRTKYVYKNKKDERDIVIRNKAKLVAQGYTQKEGIDYNKVFAAVARIELKRSKVSCLSSTQEGDGGTELRKDDGGAMKKFQMSSMRELTFFLGLQVKQMEDGIFISQDKYVDEILNKFGFSDVKTASTPMETHKTLLKDEKGEDVDTGLISWQCKSPNCEIANSHNEQKFQYLIASIAFTVNPTIFVSCIEQFWTTRVVMKINGEAHIHALIDGKKVVVSEATIRRDLQLVDEGGMDCLPKCTGHTIFEELTRMVLVRKTILHRNEFSSTMPSAIICLATNQQFNFSKFILEGMLRNLDTEAVKFLMYPSLHQTRRGRHNGYLIKMPEVTLGFDWSSRSETLLKQLAELKSARTSIPASTQIPNGIRLLFIHEQEQAPKLVPFTTNITNSHLSWTKAMKRVNTFVDMDTEVVEGSSKRAGEAVEHESTKKQKADMSEP
ncbi:putative ribonuclease H-like domain-containing protein [Tanacetum coccineum]